MLTAFQVADRAGVERTTIVRWEQKGKVPKPQADRINGGRRYTEEEALVIIQFANEQRSQRPPAKPRTRHSAPKPIRYDQRVKVELTEEYYSTSGVENLTGRSRLVLISWERKGWIPRAFWSRKLNGRLWNREQVEEIIEFSRSREIRPDREHVP